MIRFWYEMARKYKKSGKKIWSLIYKVGKAYVNIFFPLVSCFKQQKGIDENGEIVVSLTSYPARINTVWITISSLLQQTLKPQKVILWLAKEQFTDCKIPKNLKRLGKRGLEICFCDDLKPHKKYYYAMQTYPESIIVTADDDIIYPENHLAKLWEAYLENPQCVSCLAFQKIKVKDDDFEIYKKWPVDPNVKNPGMLILPIGANGVLYPPGSLDKELFNIEIIRKDTLYTDDLWLRCMGIKKNTPVYVADIMSIAYFNIVQTMKTGLWKTNVQDYGRNDKSWALLMKDFPDIKDKIIKISLLEE